MFITKKIVNQLTSILLQQYVRSYRVTIVGGASDIGQTVSLMLRAQPSIRRLNIHDTVIQTPGVVMEISHIPADSVLKGYVGEETLDRAIKDSDIVIAAGGIIKKPGTSQKKLLATNSAFIKTFATKVANTTPLPMIGILTEPINILVPMAAEVMKTYGDYDSKKLFGITTIDQLRAQSLYAAQNNMTPRECTVPVIGGRSSQSAVPLISQAKPNCKMSDKDVQEFCKAIRNCDENVTMAKKGWPATLTPAYSALIFTRSLLAALDGCPTKVAAFVENNDFGTGYFGGIVNINQNGVTDMQRFSNLSKFECHLLERSIESIREDVTKGKKIRELA